MKPFRILMFFVAVSAVLLAVSMAVPGDGIRLGENLILRFVNPGEIFMKDTLQYTGFSGSMDLSNISEDPEFFDYENIELLIDSIDPEILKMEMGIDKTGSVADGDDPGINENISDAAATENVVAGPLPENEKLPPEENMAVGRLNVDSLKISIQPLELTSEGKKLLSGFFHSIDQVKDGERERIRILHYGDSQIESDRMTSLIRFRLQNYFGGHGCGLVPAIPLYAGNPAFTEKAYGDFRRFTVFGKKDTSINHNSYGVLGCFTSVPQSNAESVPSIEYQFRSDRQAGRFERIKLYIHSYSDSASVTIKVNDLPTDTMRFIDGGFSIINFKPDTIVDKLVLGFDFREGGRLYGISFESVRGIQMDNIAMRGSSGLVFSKMDPEVFKDMVDEMRVGLMVMQFGGNIVPYISDFRYYKRTFLRELDYLKKIFPGVPIIIIGPSDMSVKENGRFVTHPSVEPVRNALRDAAVESGFIFWDLYEAMGGYNSMPSFVNSDPPLARPDYIHFSPVGANFMAEKFYNALMLEYWKYKSGNSSQSPVGSNQSPVGGNEPVPDIQSGFLPDADEACLFAPERRSHLII